MLALLPVPIASDDAIQASRSGRSMPATAGGSATADGPASGTDTPFMKIFASLRSAKRPAAEATDAEPRDAGGSRDGARKLAGPDAVPDRSGRTASNRRGVDADAQAAAVKTRADRRFDIRRDAEALARVSGDRAGATPAPMASPDDRPGARAAASLDGGRESDRDRKRLARPAGEPGMAAALVIPAPSANARQPSPAHARDRGAVDGVEGTGKSEVRNDRNRKEARVSVVDLRIKAGNESRDADRPGVTARAGRGAERGASHDDPARQRAGVSVERGAPETRDRGADAVARPTASSAFADALATRLRGSGGTDIVRAAQVVLKDGDAGLIRLRLEPESLGGVKIELKMADKHISGRIVVESDLAGEAFESSLDSLRDAFAESGFETTSLQVEVRSGTEAGAGRDGEGSDPFFSARLRELDAAVPAALSATGTGSGGRDGLLDIVI